MTLSTGVWLCDKNAQIHRESSCCPHTHIRILLTTTCIEFTVPLDNQVNRTIIFLAPKVTLLPRQTVRPFSLDSQHYPFPLMMDSALFA